MSLFEGDYLLMERNVSLGGIPRLPHLRSLFLSFFFGSSFFFSFPGWLSLRWMASPSETQNKVADQQAYY